MTVRSDIQALRGLAVLLVLFDHAKIGVFEAGYLGVDVFFVISGFLITGMVRDGLLDGSFSFAGFYFRRAKRLLPAAYVTFAITGAVVPHVLGWGDYRDFVYQLAGAISFTGNIALWLQSGYFDSAAELKPLLHVWSLSIEEQYYLLMPATMAIVPSRLWRGGAILLLSCSLLLCLAILPFYPSAAFYLLPTRAWELALGSVAALGVFSGARARAVAAKLFWPAVVALAVLPCLPIRIPHPGVAAMVVCAATLVVILREHPGFDSNVGARVLAVFGDFSYSLYLVHWPIFAFLNHAYVGEVAVLPRVVAMLLAVVAAQLLYRTVELPVRRSSVTMSWKNVIAVLVASCAIVVLPVAVSRARPADKSYDEVRRINVGFDQACEYDADDFVPPAQCMSAAHPEVLVWGDSFAMHLVPGIVSVAEAGVVQATRSSCGPLLGLAPVDLPNYPERWAESCIRFNDSVLAYVARTESIRLVIVASPFSAYLPAKDARRGQNRVLDRRGSVLAVNDPGASLAIDAMSDTIESLRRLGKRVIVVAPPPSTGVDIGRCLERSARGKLVIGAAPDCRLPFDDYVRYQAPVIDFLVQVRNRTKVEVVDLASFLCSGASCLASENGTFLYRDKGHLSYDGSRHIARRMDWSRLMGLERRQ